MVFPDRYSILKENSVITNGTYSLVPIRYADRLDIMKWRNEQMYHLRQKNQLTEEDQNNYFENVVATLFDQAQPNQILFSYLEGDTCIGYGGLVHINWTDKHAEISFIMDTALEEEHFNFHWKTYLELIKKVAFQHLHLHKIYTYAFDLRPHLYVAVEEAGFTKEAELKEHVYYDGAYRSVVIHSHFNPSEITFRKVSASDKWLIYNWSNDTVARKNSFNSDFITKNEHEKWFDSIIKDSNSLFLIILLEDEHAGFVRFQNKESNSIIGINIDKKFRGRKLGAEILRQSSDSAFAIFQTPIHAYIKEDNKASIKSFEKAGYQFLKNDVVNDIPCLVYAYEK